jgi:hemoglobin-like flavoprotein
MCGLARAWKNPENWFASPCVRRRVEMRRRTVETDWNSGDLCISSKAKAVSMSSTTSATSSIPNNDIENVRASYGRCCLSKTFFDDFYAAFTTMSPRIGPKFANTDMAKQKALLRQGITFMIMFSGGSKMAVNTINDLGKSHCKQKLDIAPEMYQFWTRALVSTVKKNDPQFTTDLEKAWNKVMTPGVERMKSMYLTG